jgi:small subunit ribosomal protein S8
MLTRIRNAINVRKHEVRMPHSKVKQSVAELFNANNYVDRVTVEGDGIAKELVITINAEQSNARITEIVRLSKPGRRYYSSASEIPTVKRGRGLVIVSTSKGMMTGDQAKAQKVGGELICKVY